MFDGLLVETARSLKAEVERVYAERSTEDA
jgi:hypothetical protein